MWDPWQVINSGYPNVQQKFIDFFPHSKYNCIFLSPRETSCPYFTSLYSQSFPQVEHFECTWESKNISRALDWRKTRVQLCSSSSLHLYMSFMSPIQLHSVLSYRLPLFTFLGPFFPSGHYPLPFVHNVRLFIFHSCLLCLAYFFSSPPPFCYFSFEKRCILNCIGTILKCIRDVFFWPFLIWYNCLKQILFFNLPVCF